MDTELRTEEAMEKKIKYVCKQCSCETIKETVCELAMINDDGGHPESCIYGGTFKAKWEKQK